MKKLISWLKSEESKNILVIGDLMIDEYRFGSVDRISPEAPVPVVFQERVEWSLGGAANVAANCRQIGCQVTLVGVINDTDYAGNKFLSLLAEQRLSTRGIVHSVSRPTTAKTRIMAQNQQMIRVDQESKNTLTPEEFNAVCSRIDEHMSHNAIVIISDYAKGVVTRDLIAYVMKKAHERNCSIIVDPKGPDFTKYMGVNIIKPNVKEFNQMVVALGLSPHDSIEANGKRLCHMLQIQGLMVTMGEKGIAYITSQSMITSPAFKREVYDLTGAGDTVIAFLALSFAHKLSIEIGLKLANYAASVAIAHIKTYAVSLDELLDSTIESNEKIFHDWAHLKIELDWQRADGKKVVFTNGTFDILHPGHIQVLKEARRLGDILVVALNTDDSVRRYKGDSRPVNGLDHRLTVIASLGVVSFVVPFNQDTPKEIIEYLRPDVLVKGGDYKKEEIVGYDIVTSYGGSVHIIDFVEGHSTTRIITSISRQSKEGKSYV